MPFAFRLRRFDREWLRSKPLHLSLMFRSAGIESAALWTRYGPGWRRRHKAEEQPAVGSHGTTSETTHRVAREPQKKQSRFVAAFLLLGWLQNAR
jgi:hypothetical protein